MGKTVGIIGLGIMGSAISRNLVERGWQVIGFDIDAARRAEAAEANVTIAADVGQVARDASMVMTSLPTPAAVAQVAPPRNARGTDIATDKKLSDFARLTGRPSTAEAAEASHPPSRPFSPTPSLRKNAARPSPCTASPSSALLP